MGLILEEFGIDNLEKKLEKLPTDRICRQTPLISIFEDENEVILKIVYSKSDIDQIIAYKIVELKDSPKGKHIPKNESDYKTLCNLILKLDFADIYMIEEIDKEKGYKISKDSLNTIIESDRVDYVSIRTIAKAYPDKSCGEEATLCISTYIIFNKVANNK